MNVKEFQRSLKKEEVPRACLFYGQEEHFKNQLIEEIRNRIHEDSEAADLGTVTFDGGRNKEGENLTANRIFEELQTLPLLSPHKLVVVRQTQKVFEENAEEFVELLTEFMKAKSVSGTLVLHTQGAVAKIVKAASSKGVVAVDCKKLYDTKAPWKRGPGASVSETATWLSTEARQLGHSLDPMDAELIVEKLGGNLTRLRQELDKLSLLAGEKNPIRRTIVEETLGGSSERTHATYQWTDAVVGQQVSKALAMLGSIFSEGLDMGPGDRSRVTHPSSITLILLSSLFKRYANLYEGARLVSQGQSPAAAAAHVGLKGYPAKKFAGEVTRHRLADLEATIPLFRIAERDVKGGSALGPQLILETLVIHLIQGKALPASVRPKREAWR